MPEILKIFPIELVILTIILVIIPTVISAVMRISLYRHLKDLVKKTNRLLINGESKGIQPKFLTQLEIRFSAASKELEQVNSLALIDGVYSQEKLPLFGFQLLCESGEYITKTLPNLLLAFGLLGTFLGITFNLYNISQIIDIQDSDIANLTNQLQAPLQSMGIAFITSLIALFCSSLLTAINIKWNVNLAKNKLLINLEDYLDNIYKPLVEGDTRLDKAVDRMVKQQQEFLERFHENVGQVLEKTFTKAANRIADDNEKAQQLATQVYGQLFNVSSNLLNGSNIFQDSMRILENQVNQLEAMLPTIKSNVDLFSASTTKFMDSAIKIEKSKFSENLENITVNLAHTQNNFTETTELLAISISDLTTDNKKAVELAQQVYQELKNASESLQKGSIMFADHANTIKDSKFNENLVNATTNLARIQEGFNEMANSLIQIVKPIETNIQSLELSTNKMSNLAKNIQQTESKIDNINSRYLEMISTSREILLKLGANSVQNIANYSELLNHIKIINQELEERLKLLENNEKLLLAILKKMFENLDNSNDSSNNQSSRNSGKNYGKSSEWEQFWNDDWQKFWNK